MQCACAILSSLACPALRYFPTLSHKRCDFIRKRELLNITDASKLTVAFRKFPNAPKKVFWTEKWAPSHADSFCSQCEVDDVGESRTMRQAMQRCELPTGVSLALHLSASASSLSSAKMRILKTLSAAKLVQRRWRSEKKLVRSTYRIILTEKNWGTFVRNISQCHMLSHTDWLGIETGHRR